jgi:hypothetical protein
MKITRRFAVASLLVIAVAVVLGAPAPASAAQHVKLYPAAGSPSPNASGTVTLSGYYRGLYTVVSVSVSKLAPNTSYYMPVRVNIAVSPYEEVIPLPIQTDARGNGKGGWRAPNSHYGIPPQFFQVYGGSGVVLTSNP